MKRFAALYAALDETTQTSRKAEALARYFREAPPADAAWSLAFLSGRRLTRLVPAARLAAWAAAEAKIPDWLFAECYDAVGDLAESIALVLPAGEPGGADLPLAKLVEERALALKKLDEPAARDVVVRTWRELGEHERFVYNKVLTGAFRVGVSARMVARGLAAALEVPVDTIAHRLMGDWGPTAEFFASLREPPSAREDPSRPYPFLLAHPLQEDPRALGDVGAWQVEWKWDGIRGQLIKRDGQCFLWSRGEELVTQGFPEIAAAGAALPDGTVIDGEILPWRRGVLPFSELQRRLNRKQLARKLLEEVPVVLVCYDVLEYEGRDVRGQPLAERRALLESALVSAFGPGGGTLMPSPRVEARGWDELEKLRAESRARGVEGFMLKRLDSPYAVGRVTGLWWKWKIDPLTADAVLVYAQRGSGKRASLYTDYTFAVWDGGELVPVAKAYSGLTDEEIREVDAFVRRNTIEKFGPVRHVKPELVFELGFEGIARSGRHRSGVAVRFPRMLRWRRDKKPEEADTLDSLRALLPPA